MKKYLIKVNGNQYEVEVEEIGGSSTPVATPAAPAATASSPAPKAASSVPAGSKTVNAPMPGTILKVNVEAGQTVSKGQVLLVLEAMKMENEIVAPFDGKVASVNAAKGSSVNAGDVLIAME